MDLNTDLSRVVDCCCVTFHCCCLGSRPHFREALEACLPIGVFVFHQLNYGHLN
jgi:hypothetical protein